MKKKHEEHLLDQEENGYNKVKNALNIFSP